MRDGTIILYKFHDTGKFTINNIVGRCIPYFTQGEYSHASIYFEGLTYEMVSKGCVTSPGVKRGTAYYDLGRDLGEVEHLGMKTYLNYINFAKWKYNFLKLVTLAVVYNTRWIWKKLNWVPFDNAIFGEICSGIVDEAYAFAGLQLFPDEPNYIAPNTIPDSQILSEVII